MIGVLEFCSLMKCVVDVAGELLLGDYVCEVCLLLFGVVMDCWVGSGKFLARVFDEISDDKNKKIMARPKFYYFNTTVRRT